MEKSFNGGGGGGLPDGEARGEASMGGMGEGRIFLPPRCLEWVVTNPPFSDDWRE